MVIIIKDYKWKETEQTLIITVPLHGVHRSKADLFYCKQFLKASFDQFYFEVFLLNPIEPSNSKCTLTDTHIVFELIKEKPKQWEKLEKDLLKSDKLSLKAAYIEEELQRQQKEKEEINNRKSELKRVAVREQMALDARQHKQIENIKETEKQNALKDIDAWNNKTAPKKTSRKKRIVRNVQQFNEAEEDIPPPVILPAVRQFQEVNVEFTPREFPTPSRESRLDEENEWLRKQSEARRSAGFISEDIRPEERNPQFLKAKGDEFMKTNNYLGAISAYTFGIKINDKFADLYVARSEAHFQIGNYNKTAQDCSRALELMKPECSLNLRERAFCIGLRGLALIKLGMLQQGIGEIKASLKLQPSEQLEKSLIEAENKLDELSD